MSLPRHIYAHRGRFRVQKMVQGKLTRRSFPTLEEAVAFLSMLIRDAEDQRAVEVARVSGALTIMDIVRVWWLGPVIDGEQRGGHRRRLSGQTLRNYQYYIDAYISRIGDASAQAYARDPGLLKAFYDSLPNRCAWHVHGVLRMVFRDAFSRGVVDRNPCMEVKPAPRKRQRRIIPSRAEVQEILACAEEQDPQWGLFVYLTATLGTRCGETVALRAEDFDEARSTVHVDRALSKTAGGPTIKEPKNGQARALAFDHPAFWDYVRPFLGAPGYLFPGFHRDRPRRDAPTKPWHPDHAQARFRDMVRALGMPSITLHALRHSVATQLLIEGLPINQVAEFLGHSPQMTLMLYGRHLDRDAMLRVGRAATGLTSRARTGSEGDHRASEDVPTYLVRRAMRPEPRTSRANHGHPGLPDGDAQSGQASLVSLTA